MNLHVDAEQGVCTPIDTQIQTLEQLKIGTVYPHDLKAQLRKIDLAFESEMTAWLAAL